MPIFKDILLQLFFVILPVFLCQNMCRESTDPRSQRCNLYKMAMLSSLSVLLCMTFPVQTAEGQLFHLCVIPLFTVTLYGGIVPGIITTLVIIASHLYLTEGEYSDVAVYILYGILASVLHRRWHRHALGKKMLLILLVGAIELLVSLVVMVVTPPLHQLAMKVSLERLIPLMQIAIIQLLGMGVVVYLSEFVRETFMLRSQVERSEKLNLISELAASVAHEVRNPLTVVRGFIQLLRDQSDPKGREYIHLVLTELDRAEFIISDYLSLAKQETETKTVLDLGEIVKEVSAIMSSYAVMNRVDLHISTGEFLFIVGDGIKVKQALMNLMKNGIESMPDGGSLDVHAKQNGKQVTVLIEDSGQGMSREQIRQLGLPYYSTKEKGTGLGLMVTFRIIESMGGTLRFDSEPDEGTRVTITLPAV